MLVYSYCRHKGIMIGLAPLPTLRTFLLATFYKQTAIWPKLCFARVRLHYIMDSRLYCENERVLNVINSQKLVVD